MARVAALEHVANRPIVHHVLDGLAEAGVDDLVIAGEPDALIDVRGVLHDYVRPMRRIEFAVCRGGGVRSVMSAAAAHVGEEPCLLQPADGLIGEPVAPLVGLLDTRADLVLLPGLGWAAESVRPRRSVPTAAEVALFGAGAWRHVTATSDDASGATLTDVGDRLERSGARVRVHPVSGWHRYRGDAAELLELNRVALDRVTTEVPPLLDPSNRLEGRVLIDPTADVRDSAIVGPVVIGPDATIVDSYLGPYTSVGAGARIEGAEVERSIIHPRASVMHVGGRLAASIVGRDARVFRDFSLPRALRLLVGDGDEIALC
jgi:glucose-1-phosphate thymidylyltransferase